MARGGAALREQRLAEIQRIDETMRVFTGKPTSAIADVRRGRRGRVLIELVTGSQYGPAHAVTALGRLAGAVVASMIERAENPLAAAILAVKADRYLLERVVNHYGLEPDGRTLEDVPKQELERVALVAAGKLPATD